MVELKKNVKFIDALRIYPDGIHPMLVSGGQIVSLAASLANSLVRDVLAVFVDQMDIDEENERIKRIKEIPENDPDYGKRIVTESGFREPNLGGMNFKTSEILAEEAAVQAEVNRRNAVASGKMTEEQAEMERKDEADTFKQKQDAMEAQRQADVLAGVKTTAQADNERKSTEDAFTRRQENIKAAVEGRTADPKKAAAKKTDDAKKVADAKKADDKDKH